MLYVVILLALLLVAAVVYAWMQHSAVARQAPAIKQLEKENNNYQSIIDQANDAMLVIDIVDGRIHQANPSAGALLGYSQEELQKKSLFDLHPKTELNKSSSIVADVWEKGGLIYKDIPFVTKSGELLPVECSAKVAPFAGRPAIVIYARDIRERLRLEQEISFKNEIIEQKNKDITDSINYARRIQEAILPTEEEMSKVVEDSFVFYRPKDIVSGDFYWAASVTTTPPGEQKRRLSVIAAVDCTGHGVPGAFMSIVGHTLLNQTTTQPSVNSPAEALDYLNREVIKTLKQNIDDDYSIKDGMDIALCAIDHHSLIMQFAGANNPVYIVRGQEVFELPADKQPIGVHVLVTKPFTNHQFQLQPNDRIFLFTDGFADQFGGPKGKKYRYKQFKDVLQATSHLPMNEQKLALERNMNEWMSYPSPQGTTYEQIDDMLVIGICIH